MNREKTINGLEQLKKFAIKNDMPGIEKTTKSAIELLKDQEPVEPELEGGGSTWWHVCGECHGTIDEYDNFCRHCGRRIKHEKKE